MSRFFSAARNVPAFLALVLTAGGSQAQTPAPPPGPTNPTPMPSMSKERTIVINPTIEECRLGWLTGSAWTKEQFDKFCTEIRQSK